MQQSTHQRHRRHRALSSSTLCRKSLQKFDNFNMRGAVLCNVMSHCMVIKTKVMYTHQVSNTGPTAFMVFLCDACFVIAPARKQTH